MRGASQFLPDVDVMVVGSEQPHTNVVEAAIQKISKRTIEVGWQVALHGRNRKSFCYKNVATKFRGAERCQFESGGDDVLAALQAGGEATQRAVFVRAAALDEERVDARMQRAQRVDVDRLVAPDHRAR